MFITKPESFEELFNQKVPGAYRKVAANDIRFMTKCGLIGRYGSYVRQDLETVRGVLQYEQCQEHQSTETAKGKQLPTCKSMKRSVMPIVIIVVKPPMKML